jgi:MFS family permease
VAAAILCGAASGGLAIGQSYVLRKSRDTRRVKILGSFGVARNAGYIAGLGFGAAIAIFPDANLQHRAGFLIPAALALGAGVPAARFLSKSPLVPNAASRMNSRDAITHTWREARESLTFIGLRTFTYLGLVTLFPYVLQGWFGFSISQTALAFVGMALLGVLAQGKLAGWLERQANLTCGIAIGFGLLGIGGACVSVYSLALWPFYIGVACVVIGYQLLIPFQLADLSKRVSKGNDGLGIGLALVAASIIGPLGPLVFGGIATIGTFEWSFGFATTVALIIFGFLVRRCFEYTTLQ